MADLPLALEGDLPARLARVLDTEGKILRAIESLGPVADRDVVLLGDAEGLRARQLTDLGARLVTVDDLPAAAGIGSEAVDVLVAWWSGFRGVNDADLRVVDGLLRPGGRLLVIHDYGRDDVSRLRGDLPEYGLWSRRDGPFLRSGFRIRVLHCWWTFDSLDEARAFLGEAFGETGASVAADLKRPRLSYNVAIYHRSRHGEEPVETAPGGQGAGV